MNKQIFIFLILPLMFQCSQEETESKSIATLSEVDTIGIKTENKIDFTNNTETVSKDSCNCNWKQKKFTHYTDLMFTNNGTLFNVDVLAMWKDNPERLDIKSLRLVDFDSIPLEMGLFENVEMVYIDAIKYKNVQGLELFPKLRILKAEEARFEINEHTKWIDRIEVIHVNKTEFSGIKSFHQMPNLKEVKMSFSGFDVFPTDFESLKCLSYFQTGGHTFCEIDLTKLNFTNMFCLKFVEFQSWRDNIKGIPDGIGNVKTVKINHPNLTKMEREILKEHSGH